jgi:hypothetical protein
MPIRYPIDVALNRSWEHGLDVLGVRPWPVLHDLGSQSTIGAKRFDKKGEKGPIALRIERRLRKGLDSLAKRALVTRQWIGDARARRQALADGAISRSDR